MPPSLFPSDFRRRGWPRSELTECQDSVRLWGVNASSVRGSKPSVPYLEFEWGP